MKIKNLWCILTLLTTITLISQTKSLDTVYANYFNNEREIPYLHLNKTSYLKGEEVWFKAYVLNLNTQKLHKSTTNLYCTIYDDKGVYKDRKLLFIKNGIASGNFKLDSTFTNRDYYLKVETNYMKNFKEDESFLQKITIVNNRENTTNAIVEENNYDLQVLPEGGHLLSNSLNAVGIILRDKKGDSPKNAVGELINQNGNVIERFTLNRFGLAKVLFYVEKGEGYTARVTLPNDEIVTKVLPGKALRGVTLAVEDISDNMMKFIVNTNQETIESLQGKSYHLLIHNTNSYLKRKIKFKANSLSYSLFLIKKLFKPGANIATLFNEENKPLAERVFFNFKPSLIEDINVDLKDVDEDSLTVSFHKKVDSTQYYFLSASILPYRTKAYKPDQTIYSKFLLQPYIKGLIKNSDYFFKDVNRKKLQELDLVLLTQGWSKYKWFNIFNTPPTKYYQFEKGISLKGTINMKDVNDSTKVYLVSNANNLVMSSFLKNNNVEFKNLYIKEADTINFSFLDRKNTLKSIKAYIRSYPALKKDNIKFSDTSKRYIKKKKAVKEEVVLADAFVLDEFEFLNEVEVKAKYVFKNNPDVIGNETGYKIDETYPKYGRILDFIRSKGFIVNEDLRSVTIVNREGSGLGSPFNIYLNSFQITDIPNDMLYLRQLRNIDVEEIFISNSFGGEIHIFTKKNVRDTTDPPFLKYPVPLGFSVEKEFYQPKYASTQSKIFKNYGTLYWNPNITLEPNVNTLDFKIPHLNQKDIKIFIEGIGANGELIHQVKTFTNIKELIE
ncbi:hypothetical protein [uncultured Tenacibaculum sp.]|uniref:hypothetical protein n=1 Tax=uncultured Tenacibaculum sp. TaxID=174713 RepID=UPI00262654CA|nr:hypothetical protein [uncultured Tenacibaculum sp.]